jgi:hypothetical protein
MKNEIKINVWLARNKTVLLQNTRVHYGKPELNDGIFRLDTPGKRKIAWNSNEFKAVENFILPGECIEVEITIRKTKKPDK